MPVTEIEIGGPVRTSRVASREETLTFAQVIAAAIDESNLTSFAHRIGWPEQSCRRYRDGLQTPTLERLLDVIQAGRVPPTMHLQLVLLIANGAFTIGHPSAAAPVVQRNQASNLRELAMRLSEAEVQAAREVHNGLSDGRLDPDEALRIHAATMNAAHVAQDLSAAAMQRRGGR